MDPDTSAALEGQADAAAEIECGGCGGAGGCSLCDPRMGECENCVMDTRKTPGPIVKALAHALGVPASEVAWIGMLPRSDTLTAVYRVGDDTYCGSIYPCIREDGTVVMGALVHKHRGRRPIASVKLGVGPLTVN